MSDEVEAFTHAFLENIAMEELQSYLERGRRFQEMPVENLNQAWADAFDRYLAQGDEKWRDDYTDLGAEMRARKLGKPVHLVIEALERARDRNSKMKGTAEGDRAMRADIDRFVSGMQKPKS